MNISQPSYENPPRTDRLSGILPEASYEAPEHPLKKKDLNKIKMTDIFNYEHGTEFKTKLGTRLKVGEKGAVLSYRKYYEEWKPILFTKAWLDKEITKI